MTADPDETQPIKLRRLPDALRTGAGTAGPHGRAHRFARSNLRYCVGCWTCWWKPRASAHSRTTCHLPQMVKRIWCCGPAPSSWEPSARFSRGAGSFVPIAHPISSWWTVKPPSAPLPAQCDVGVIVEPTAEDPTRISVSRSSCSSASPRTPARSSAYS